MVSPEDRYEQIVEKIDDELEQELAWRLEDVYNAALDRERYEIEDEKALLITYLKDKRQQLIQERTKQVSDNE